MKKSETSTTTNIQSTHRSLVLPTTRACCSMRAKYTSCDTAGMAAITVASCSNCNVDGTIQVCVSSVWGVLMAMIFNIMFEH